MKKLLSLFLSFIMIISAVPVFAAESHELRTEVLLNRDWLFSGENISGAQMKYFDDSTWKKINLPHDFSIEHEFTEAGTDGESGSLPGGNIWYRKHFTLPASLKNKSFMINFGRSYNNTCVYVNGRYAGENHYGYNSFSFDISDYLICDGKTANVIAVNVIHNIPSGRWYSGTGLNADITLSIYEKVHVGHNGTHIIMPELKKSSGADGRLETAVNIENDTEISKTVKVKNTLYDKDKNVKSVSEFYETAIPPYGETEINIINGYKNPVLWDVDNPYLYTLKTEIFENDGKTLIDSYETVTGFRYFDFNKTSGFSLNGRNLKLKGVCMHHDQGALGAAQEYDAVKRQTEILKDMGANAVRTSHNCASPALIKACEETGLLVMEEFFDGWDSPKAAADKIPNIHDFSEYFSKEIPAADNPEGAESGMTWAEFVVSETVKRDRSSPAVIIWSAGNEVLHGTDRSNYPEVARMISETVHALDKERPLTEGNNAGGQGKNAELDTIDKYMDVIGGNYFPDSWVNSYASLEKPFVATESASAVGTRGVYKNRGDQIVSNVAFADNSDKTINAYDNSCVSWGDYAAESWYYAALNDWFSGEFVWTGFDYIGEPTPWNVTDGPQKNAYPNSSYFGITDTAGLPKDSYYLYRSLWNEKEHTLHLVPTSWNSENLNLQEGFIDVAVYSDADNIELYLNGSLIGRAESHMHTTDAGHSYRTWTAESLNQNICRAEKFNQAPGSDFYPQFRVKYEAGELSVKGYKGNEEISAAAAGIKKAVTGNADRITAEFYKDSGFTADGRSLIYVQYKAVDSKGNLIPTFNGTLDINVQGGIIKGVDNGNPAEKEKFQASVIKDGKKQAHIKLSGGMAIAIIGTEDNAGEININTVSRENLPVNSLKATVNGEKGEELYDEFEELFIQKDTDILPCAESVFAELKNKADSLTAEEGEKSALYNLIVSYAKTDITDLSPSKKDSLVSRLEHALYVYNDKNADKNKISDAVNMLKGVFSDSTVKCTDIKADTDGNIIFYVVSSSEAREIIIKDENGALIKPFEISCKIGEGEKRWTVKLSGYSAGTYVFTLSPAFEGGFTESGKGIEVSVSVPEKPKDDGGIIGAIKAFFNRIKEFFRKVLGFFGIKI